MKPRKKRDVAYPPGIQYFKPQGIPLNYLVHVNLTIDEYEALRLADYEKLKHEEAAVKMNISRPTFTRLLESAHTKISDAIVNGKAIRIEGGDFRFLKNRFRCRRCGSFWDIENVEDIDNIENVKDIEDGKVKDIKNKNLNCPRCNSGEVDDIAEMLILQCRHGKRHRFGNF